MYARARLPNPALLTGSNLAALCALASHNAHGKLTMANWRIWGTGIWRTGYGKPAYGKPV